MFVIVGIFAALAAIGARSRPADSKDALHALLNEPFGQALLAAIAAGLLCFAVWRLSQALGDRDERSTEPTSLVRRAIWVGSALFYIGFAWVAVTMIMGAGTALIAIRWPMNGPRGYLLSHSGAGWLARWVSSF